MSKSIVQQIIFFVFHNAVAYYEAKPQVSLTAPNRDHFLQVSLTVLGAFLGAIAKVKKLFRETIAQDLVQV